MRFPSDDDMNELASRQSEASSILKNVNIASASKGKESSLSSCLPNSEVYFPSSTLQANLSTSLSDHDNQRSTELKAPSSPFVSCTSHMVPSSETTSLKEKFLSSVQLHPVFEAPKKPCSMNQEFSPKRHSLLTRPQDTSDTHSRRPLKRKSLSFGTASSLNSSNSNIKHKRRNSIHERNSFLLSESGSITNIIPLGIGLTRTKSLLNEEFSLASSSMSPSKNDSSSKVLSFSRPLEIKPPQCTIVNEKDDTTMAIAPCDNDQWMKEETAKFDNTLDNFENFNCDAKSLLRKTRSVSVLARRLLLAESEAECYEIVGRLMVSLFGVGRCTFALMTDAENYILKEFSVQDQYLKEITFLSNGEDTIEAFPLSGGIIEDCALSLDALYFPDTRKSTYFEHEQMHQFGLRTALTVPILVGARKFAGAFTVAISKANAFTEMDIILIKDIAHSLGAHLYSKRLQEEQTESYNVSRELLQAMIPAPVLEKIEQHWECPDNDSNDTKVNGPTSKNIQDQMEDSQAKKILNQTKERLEKLNIIRKDKNDLHNLGHTGHCTEFKSEIPSESSPVLFAETQSNVSIIFTDIVGFSRISRQLKPIQVMQMLQDLYHKFDLLCEKHGVQKLETIGDAYIVSAGLLEGDNQSDNGRDAAKRCLAMAQDMVREAYHVFVPTEPKERLTIRAGIHVGQLSYGVLGQKVPKFSVYGDAVNLAARMEQTCPVGMVHVSGAFYNLIGDDAVTWQEKRLTKVKNIGELETWLLNPMRVCTRKSNSGRRWLQMLRSQSGKHWVA